MNAVLLAAGLGTRLDPLTRVLPKCLMPINGRPLLEYWLEALILGGVGNIMINLHYFPELVQEWLSGIPDGSRIQVVHEYDLLGTGGTLLKNKSFAGDGAVMLAHADNLCTAPINDFLKAHEDRPPEAAITMMTFRSPRPESCGIVAIDSLGLVQAFHEKVPDPPGNLANAAVYIVEKEVIAFMESFGRQFVDFSTEVLPHYIGRIFTFHNECYHRDIGTTESLLAAQVEFDGSQPTRYRSQRWAPICHRIASDFERAFETAIAGQLSLPYSAGEGHSSNCAGFAQSPASAVAAFEKAETGPGERMVVCIRNVPATFSAKQFYENHGIESLAMCAGAKSIDS